MKYTTQNQTSDMQSVQPLLLKTFSKLRPASMTLVVVLSAFALTACGGSGGDDSVGNSGGGNTHGDTNHDSGNLPPSTLNATYYQIDEHMGSKDVNKRYTNVTRLTINNGKVTNAVTFPAIGTEDPNSSPSDYSNHVILAENFSLKGQAGLDADEFMDTPTWKMRLYPDNIKTTIIDNSTNNSLIISGKGEQIDLSGQKVYDQNPKIYTEIYYKNGSVSEVYPQGAGCWALSYEGFYSLLSSANKPYWEFESDHPSSYTDFSDWQNEVKKRINNRTESHIDGEFTKIKVGSNNEYDAQMIKIKTNDPKNGIKMTAYEGAVKYQGKIYTKYSLPHPKAMIEIDLSVKGNDSKQCALYNEVAKDYIINQLKTLP